MKINILLGLLKNLSDSEIKEFEKYLKSPFFNNVKFSLIFFKEIIKNRDSLVISEPEKIIEKLSKKFKMTNGMIRKQFSYLSKGTVNFFKVRAFINNRQLSDLVLNDYLLKIKAFELLNNNIEKKRNSDLTSEMPEDEEVICSYKNNIIYFESLIQSPRESSKVKRKGIMKSLKDSTEDISLYTLMQFTGLYVNYFFLDVNYGYSRSNEFPLNLSDKFEEYERVKLFNDNTYRKKLFYIYYNLFLAINRRSDKTNYVRYKNSVLENLGILNARMRKFHYKVLINFCITKDRLGEDKKYFKKENLELMSEYFGKNYFKVDDDYLKHTEFSNFVVNSFSSGDFKTLKSFIDNNACKLKSSDYLNMVNYGHAYYYFGLKNFKKVLKHINDITLNNFIYTYDIKNLELRVYYELKKINLLIDAIHNYRAKILDDDLLTKNDKESLLMMLNYFNKLISLNPEKKIKEQELEIEYIIRDIEKKSLFSLQKWLLEKFKDVLLNIKKTA